MDRVSRSQNPSPSDEGLEPSTLAIAMDPTPASIETTPSTHCPIKSPIVNISLLSSAIPFAPLQPEHRPYSGGAHRAKSNTGEAGRTISRSWNDANSYDHTSPRLLVRRYEPLRETRPSPYSMSSRHRPHTSASPDGEDIGSSDSTFDSDYLSDSCSSISIPKKPKSKMAFGFSAATWNASSDAASSSSRSSYPTPSRFQRHNYDTYSSRYSSPPPQQSRYQNSPYHRQHHRPPWSLERTSYSHPYSDWSERRHEDYRDSSRYRPIRHYDRSTQTSLTRISPIPSSRSRTFVRELTPTRQRRLLAPPPAERARGQDEDDYGIPPPPLSLSAPVRLCVPSTTERSLSSSRKKTHAVRLESRTEEPPPSSGLFASEPVASFSSTPSSGRDTVSRAKSKPRGIRQVLPTHATPAPLRIILPALARSKLSSKSGRKASHTREKTSPNLKDNMDEDDADDGNHPVVPAYCRPTSRRKRRTSDPQLSIPPISTSSTFTLGPSIPTNNNSNTSTSIKFHITTPPLSGRPFSSSTRASEEEKIHIPTFKRGGKTRYACVNCAKDFSRKNDAYRHMSRKHSDVAEEFVCVCGRVLSRGDALARHQRTCRESGVKEEGDAGAEVGKGKGKARMIVVGEVRAMAGADDDVSMEEE